MARSPTLAAAALLALLVAPAAVSAATVCAGMPNAALLGSTGSWPASCAGTVGANGLCTGVCAGGYVGSPQVLCANPGPAWSNKVLGGCRQAASVCDGEPPAIQNGRWPQTRNVPDGSTITGICNPGYTNTPTPTSTCVGGAWTTPSPVKCTRVASPSPSAVVATAFVPNAGGLNPEQGVGPGLVTICSITTANTLTNCVASDGSANGGVPVNWYAQTASAGSGRVWIASIGSISVCTWTAGDNILSGCTFHQPALTGPGGDVNYLIPAVYTPGNTLLLTSGATSPAIVTVCSDALNVNGCVRTPVTFPAPLTNPSGVTACAAYGVAVGAGYAWVTGGTACPYLLRCNLGGVPLASCTTFNLAATGAVSANGLSVASDYGSGTNAFIFINSNLNSYFGYTRVLRCSVFNPTSCTWLEPLADNYGLYNSVSLPGIPALYIPSQFTPAVTICPNNANALTGAGCVSSPITGANTASQGASLAVSTAAPVAVQPPEATGA